jgi:hypothetical protein
MQSLPFRVREGIRINGEETCEPDIRRYHMQLLCARAGIALGPDEDPYNGLGPPRKEIKFAVNVMLNASSWPNARGALIENWQADIAKCRHAGRSAANCDREAIFGAWPLLELGLWPATGRALRWRQWSRSVAAVVTVL